jgi:calcium-dependent protein kinase
MVGLNLRELLGFSSDAEGGSNSDIAAHVEARVGRIPCAGRYHRKPRKLEDDYVLAPSILGSGMNGNVRLATSKTNPAQKFAVKTFELDKPKPGEKPAVGVGDTGPYNEAQNYLCLDHPHIVKLYDVYESERHLHMVMDCMEGGEVFDRLQEKRRFSEAEARDAIRQMLLALNYMHSHGMVHRDVKLENFVYDEKDGKHLRLIDFGFSAEWNPNTSRNMKKCLGTLSYVAPEVLQGSYTSQCDMWSLGVVAFALLSGGMPFYGSDSAQRRNIRSGSYFMKHERWCGISKEAKHFVEGLLSVTPANRLSAQQALEHPWLANTSSSTGFAQLNVPNVVRSLRGLRSFRDASEFRRSCMRVLALSLPREDEAKVRDQFLYLDRSQQGTITLKELRSVMVDHLHLSNENEILEIFEALDYNHDQEIHYSDFLAAAMGTDSSGSLPKASVLKENVLKSAFRRLDTDSSGSLNARNLRDTLKSGAEEGGIEACIQEIDRQGKGCVCFADFEAYLRTPLRLPQAPKSCVEEEWPTTSAIRDVIESKIIRSAEESPVGDIIMKTAKYFGFSIMW